MVEVTCGERSVTLAPDETVLDALLRVGVDVPSSCRAGACQACLVQVTYGQIPARAQVGLTSGLRARGFALACQAVPEENWGISAAGAGSLEGAGRVESVSRLSDDVLRVMVRLESELEYRAGQFVTLVRDDGLARSYSIASLPEEGAALELHVRVLVQGKMSSWLASSAALGAALRVRGPAGECFYTPGAPEQPLVLAGTGSGLAPLWGIARDALAKGHLGPIELWHGARTPSGLYLREELMGLQAAHPNFSYRPCVLEGDAREAGVGRLEQLLLDSRASFEQPRFFLCGDAALVQSLRRALFLRGAALTQLHADAFLTAPP